MRIAHILWSLGTGGTENMVVDIASVQAETEVVAIFVINDWVEDYMVKKLNPKVKLFLCKRKPGSRNPMPLVMLNYKLKAFKPDVIHTHSNRAINCVKTCWKVPIVRTSHGLWNSSHEFRRYKELIAISEAVRANMLKDGHDSTVIPNGIKVAAISNVKSQSFNDGRLHFVQVSRLHTKAKGQDTIVDAIELLKNEGINNVCMHFIGDGPSEDFLKQLVREKQLDDMVVFEGRVEQQEIYRRLANYDLFIQASRIEGFGLTIAEAMAAKVPVLVSDIPAPMEVIDNGRLGTYFHVNDAEDLASKIKLFIKKGRNSNMIETAYKYVADHYDVSVTAMKYMEVYKNVL